jgi:DNA-binding transcriptional MerR regulator
MQECRVNLNTRVCPVVDANLKLLGHRRLDPGHIFVWQALCQLVLALFDWVQHVEQHLACKLDFGLDFECTRSFSICIVTDNFISIGELSRISGISAHTLRFYETAGVLRPVGRATNGHRRYQGNDVLWLEFVLRLKTTGMPLAEIKRYAELREQGDVSLSSRLAMLKLHQERLVARMKELSESADALDDKMRTYQEMIAGAEARSRR